MEIPKEVEDNLRNRLKYPATKQVIVQAFNGSKNITEENKAWVVKIPEKVYRDADDVLRELDKASMEIKEEA